MGWYIVYILAIFINTILLHSAGIGIKDPRNWISLVCVMLAYFSGKFGV